MKIMWITNLKIPLNDVGVTNVKVSGGWIYTMLSELEKISEVEELNIVMTSSKKKPTAYKHGKVKYTYLPSTKKTIKYDSNLSGYIKKEIDIFQPDVIDVHGVEFYFITSLLETDTKVPIVATLQGLTSEIHKHYYAGISFKDLVFKRTLRDNLSFDGIFERKLKYKKRGENEIKSLKQLKYAIGRTSWDQAIALQHNENLRYYVCNRNLRKEFYENRWDIEGINKYTIFTTQAHYPIKGLHILLEAISLLKKRYPSIKLYISGKNLIEKNSIYEKLAFSGYQKIIKGQISKLKLEQNIIFTGYLNSNEIAQRLKSTHVFVIPSVIENSPNALAEAQLVGTPSVGSYTGGIVDYIDDELTGLLYNSYDAAILASKIEKIFNDDKFATEISKNSREKALKLHDIENNAQTLLGIYNQILG